MKRLLVILLFLSLFLATPSLSSPVFAAVGGNVNYTGLWRGPAGKLPGIDAGTVPANKLCKPAGYGIKLLCGPATESFEAMSAAYRKETGQKLSAPDWGGYRTKADQLNGGSTFATYNPNYAPPAHLWGTAIDFSNDRRTLETTDKEQQWLVKNGPKFGWFWPNWAKNGQGGKGGHVEPWHFNYYFIGHNPASDVLESPFTGTSPSGGNGGTSTAMACAVTEIGNAPGSPTVPAGCETAIPGQGGVILKAAQDLKATLDKCTGGSTRDSANNDSCTRSDLKTKGYTDAQLAAYISRRNDSSDGEGVQCLGWMSNAVALASGRSGVSFGLGGAPDAIGRSSLTFPPFTFVKVSSPQPGDIGFTVKDGNSFGHTLIVNSLKGQTSFVGIEANWTPYKVTNNEVHPNSKYVFFRLRQ